MDSSGRSSSTGNPSAGPRPILLVEDQPEIAAAISGELESQGHPVRHVSVAEATGMARLGDAALIILDRIIFGVDCLPNLELLRRQGIKTPVLVISSLSSVDEKVRGLKAGADDYLAKPFAMPELAARVDALLRRLEGVRSTELKVGDFEMDLVERTVHCAGAKVELLPREFDLLEYFLRRPDQLVTRAMLLGDLWKHHFTSETNVVDAHVSNLRRKIDVKNYPSRILSIRRAGFMLRAIS